MTGTEARPRAATGAPPAKSSTKSLGTRVGKGAKRPGEPSNDPSAATS